VPLALREAPDGLRVTVDRLTMAYAGGSIGFLATGQSDGWTPKRVRIRRHSTIGMSALTGSDAAAAQSSV
jgi:hypothetical protein